MPSSADKTDSKTPVKESLVLDTENNTVYEQFQRLKKNVDITASIKHRASHRFISYNAVSIYGVTASSVGLIAIPIYRALNLNRVGTDEFLTMIQVLLAVVILIVSLYTRKQDYSGKAQMMFQCGTELTELYSVMLAHDKANTTYRVYCDFLRRYMSTQRRYGDHSMLDWWSYKLNSREKYYPNPLNYLLAKVREYYTLFKFYIPFSILIFSIVFIVIFTIDWTPLFSEMPSFMHALKSIWSWFFGSASTDSP